MPARLLKAITMLLGGSRGKRGETLTEVLVSIAIGSLALLMLAMAISASTNITMASQANMDTYYDKSNTVVSAAALNTGGVLDRLVISDEESNDAALVKDDAIDVRVYNLDQSEEDTTPVILFAKKAE